MTYSSVSRKRVEKKYRFTILKISAQKVDYSRIFSIIKNRYELNLPTCPQLCVEFFPAQAPVCREVLFHRMRRILLLLFHSGLKMEKLCTISARGVIISFG